MNEKPAASIVIVNYNGAHFLRNCLNGLANQTYRKEKFEVIVSENGSADNSLQILVNEYLWVKVIQNNRNLGFTGGNNIGIKAAQGKYIILLNNDTEPAPTWLENLIIAADANPDAGIVCGKSRLFYDQITLEIETECFISETDPRHLGIQVFAIDSHAPMGVVQYLEGFYGWEQSSEGKFRWTKEAAKIGIPIPSGSDDIAVNFRLGALRNDDSPVAVKLHIAGDLLATFSVNQIPEDFKVSIPSRYRINASAIVQNAGSIVDRNGYGRDRGTYAKNNEVYFEADAGQYDQPEEIFAACGTNMLLRKTMLDQIGALDNWFFAYYEDTDLSWRAWITGWKVIYAPLAVIRHIHCGTSKEWSPLFTFLVERNRLAMLLKNGTPKQVFLNWMKYPYHICRQIGKGLVDIMLGRGIPRYGKRVLIQTRGFLSLLIWLPVLLFQRMRISQHKKIDRAYLEQRFFNG